ncbi:hypothetical protein SASPL_143482 [Salvia splendens]|uniref:Uncharacterized protein n=1 Tax=Salvia splendens TaxID=180675 RepID=A0A8X8ZA25_SALSN|nr:hypothetical protein SASPL_143482 [Salvia splendens]
MHSIEGRQLKEANEGVNKGAGKHEVRPPVASTLSHTETFQPTTPGNSPGVGHLFGTKDHSMEEVKGGKPDGFQPTSPGHSPGVGHSMGN